VNWTEGFIIIFGLCQVLIQLKNNHTTITSIEKDLKGFLKVYNFEKSISVKKNLIFAKINEYEHQMFNHNRFTKFILLVAIIGEVIFYFTVSLPTFIIFSIGAALIILSSSAIKAHLIKSLQAVKNEALKYS